jgi:hypothetical protein
VDASHAISDDDVIQVSFPFHRSSHLPFLEWGLRDLVKMQQGEAIKRKSRISERP